MYHYYIKENSTNSQGLLFKEIYKCIIVKQFRKKYAEKHMWNNLIKILENLNVTSLCLYICDCNYLIGKASEGKGYLNSNSRLELNFDHGIVRTYLAFDKCSCNIFVFTLQPVFLIS